MSGPKTSALDEELADLVQSLDEAYRELSAKGCVPAADVERQSNEAIARGLKMREATKRAAEHIAETGHDDVQHR